MILLLLQVRMNIYISIIFVINIVFCDTRVRGGVGDGPLRQDLSSSSLPSSPPETADSRRSSPPETSVSESRFRRAGIRRKTQETADSAPE